jgi:hypothetical protein
VALRAALALIGLMLILGAATQVVDPVIASDVTVDCDQAQLDEAVTPVAFRIAEPTRSTTIAVYDREHSIGRIAIYAPFRPPRATATAT